MRRGHGKGGGDSDRTALTVPEVRRLLAAEREPPERRAHRQRWSRWRRSHQAAAQRAHARRRARRAPAQAAPPGPIVPVAGTAALTDDAWTRVEPLLPPLQSGHRAYSAHRPILAGMLWVMHTGAPWRAIPERFGPWHTIHSRYQRWRDDGTWQRVLDTLRPPADPDAPS